MLNCNFEEAQHICILYQFWTGEIELRNSSSWTVRIYVYYLVDTMAVDVQAIGIQSLVNFSRDIPVSASERIKWPNIACSYSLHMLAVALLNITSRRKKTCTFNPKTMMHIYV